MFIAGGAVTVTTTGTVGLIQPFVPFSFTKKVVVDETIDPKVAGPVVIGARLITTSSKVDPEEILPERERQTYAQYALFALIKAVGNCTFAKIGVPLIDIFNTPDGLMVIKTSEVDPIQEVFGT